MGCNSWIDVDADALRANVESFRTLLSDGTQLMVVVKSNAYGHGLELAAQAMSERVDWFGVNSLDEAEALVASGIDRPVLIMGHTPHGLADRVVSGGFRQVVFRADTVRQLSEAAQAQGATARLHLKIETGTNRLGVRVSELDDFLRGVDGLPGIHWEGVYTHFANIEDTLDPAYATAQLSRFREALAALSAGGVTPELIHASASSGAILYPDVQFDMVRVGIGAYGVWPSRETQLAARSRQREVELSPALTWKSRLVQAKDVEAGESIGYGRTFQATRKIRVGVVPVGYHDGYNRLLSNRASVLVHGRRVPVVGRVAMNMLTVDVTDVDAQVDDEVVLLGGQGASRISAEELADICSTIPYEILAGIHPSLPRHLHSWSLGKSRPE